MAVCVSDHVQDVQFPGHQVQRTKDLLRCAQWVLLRFVGDLYGAGFSTKPAEGGAGAHPEATGVVLTRVLSSVTKLLQAAAVLIGEMSHCPPELLVALWTLRGYTWEKQGHMDQCFVDYLQALSVIDEAWGDPRKRGGRGHPFAMLLAWKLGLMSYCRGDVKSIDKFADYFRSLALYYAGDCCFIWGPPVWGALRPEGTKPNKQPELQEQFDEEKI